MKNLKLITASSSGSKPRPRAVAIGAEERNWSNALGRNAFSTLWVARGDRNEDATSRFATGRR